MHARYDATTGKRVAKEVEPFKLMWLEEPVPAENIDAMREVRAHRRAPLSAAAKTCTCAGDSGAAGEQARSGHHHAGFPKMWRSRWKPCKIADMAHAYWRVPVAPHRRDIANSA